MHNGGFELAKTSSLLTEHHGDMCSMSPKRCYWMALKLVGPHGGYGAYVRVA